MDTIHKMKETAKMWNRMDNLYRMEMRNHYWRTIVQVVKEILERPPSTATTATECDQTAHSMLEQPPGRFVLTDEQRTRATAAFSQALDGAVLAYDVGQLGLFHEEDETWIRREVERMLYNQKLPNGGDKERRVIERFEEIAAKADPDWKHLGRCRHAISQWKLVLPANPRNAGRYYTRKKLSAKDDKEFFADMIFLEERAQSSKEWALKWFARMMLDGLPEAVSDFGLECLFLLRKSDGSVTRLVQLKNTVGEVSRGEHHSGAVILDEDAFCSPEHFRKWCLKWGNFSWSGNQIAVQMLHEDVNRLSAWRVINQVDSVGWREVQAPKSKVHSQNGMRSGIWFCQDGAYAYGDEGCQLLAADGDGIYWWQGEGYYMNRMGRESAFKQGIPRMRTMERLVKVPGADSSADPTWEIVAGRDAALEAGPMTEFFQVIAQNFYDTMGGYEGWMLLGSVLSFYAAPEVFPKYSAFAGMWIHGQMESGKSFILEWLMHFRGYLVSAGLSLSSSTAVGLQMQGENYSNEPVSADEYRQNNMKQKEEKEAILRDSYGRLTSSKWTPDGVTREMKTTFIVSGEMTTNDSALRSRFLHAQVSASKRLKNHLIWMQANKDKFFVFGRLLLERRQEYVASVLRMLEVWLRLPELAGMNEREKLVHGLAWSSWMAICGILQSHGPEANRDFKNFMVQHAKGSAEDVKSETNINVFLQDLLTAFKAEAISHSCFRVESDYATHPPNSPNQAGGWKSYRLYIDPEHTISAINIYLRKGGGALALRAKDLRSQLSKTDYWLPAPIRKSFGQSGRTVLMACWGFDLDTMGEMGRQVCSDEAYNDWLLHKGDEADPRKGPFYAIVAAIEGAEEEARQAAR